jgi:hypothetical protein
VEATAECKEAEPPFLGRLNICYKPSVFQPSKMFGFDFHIYLTGMMVSNGYLQFLWHTLTEDT